MPASFSACSTTYFVAFLAFRSAVCRPFSKVHSAFRRAFSAIDWALCWAFCSSLRAFSSAAKAFCTALCFIFLAWRLASSALRAAFLPACVAQEPASTMNCSACLVSVSADFAKASAAAARKLVSDHEAFSAFHCCFISFLLCFSAALCALSPFFIRSRSFFSWRFFSSLCCSCQSRCCFLRWFSRQDFKEASCSGSSCCAAGRTSKTDVSVLLRGANVSILGSCHARFDLGSTGCSGAASIFRNAGFRRNQFKGNSVGGLGVGCGRS
mmetsp:Transcript_4488/g.7974  ORF Transcript_4488/g.7974 Transcript_4488/m.7974 type:complete len:268 (+) Transcript_4488:155-958(+)